MRSISVSSVYTAPPIILQSGAIRRRIAASDAVASLLASLAFGEPRRSDLVHLATITADRIAVSAERHF